MASQIFQIIAFAARRASKLVYRTLYYVLFAKYAYKYISPFAYVAPRAHVRDYNRIRLGARVIIRSNCQIGGDIELANDVRLGLNCHIFGKVTIGQHVMIAPNVVLAGGAHGISIGAPMIFQPCPPARRIIIGEDVWIGANSVILQGVTISNGAVVGAGSVVTTDIPENAIAVGNPAKVLKYRN